MKGLKMLSATRKNSGEQMQYDRKATMAFAEKRVKLRKEMLQKTAEADNEPLKQICCTLIRIAQQYVPNNAQSFTDFAEVASCIKLLQNFGVEPPIAAKFVAPVQTTQNDVVINSAPYRHLRNRAIAGFATIADLTEKPAAAGTPEFQSGVREGYRRASDVAAIFLADIQSA